MGVPMDTVGRPFPLPNIWPDHSTTLCCPHIYKLRPNASKPIGSEAPYGCITGCNTIGPTYQMRTAPVYETMRLPMHGIKWSHAGATNGGLEEWNSICAGASTTLLSR